MVRRGHIYRLLPSRVVVCVRDDPKSDECGVNCMVVGGNHATYPPGSWDIYVFFSDLEKAERIEL